MGKRAVPVVTVLLSPPMIDSNPKLGSRANLRLRLLLRFADGPMSEAAATQSGAQATATAVAAVRLQLLQAPRLLLADGAGRALERKDAALLAMLAVEGPTPRARVATLLWPDIDEDHARNNLRQRLFRLRKLTACDLVHTGTMLALTDTVVHDLDTLGPRLLADPDAAVGELLGELEYGDCPELSDWVGVARDQWRNTRRNALAEIAAKLEADGRIAPALHYAQRLAGDDPTLEHAHRRVMRLHYLRGDRAAALAAYERCREQLQVHVSARPGKETLELARLIESSGAMPQSTASALKPVTVLRPPRLVGRAREWQVLEQARDAWRAALVLGEPGVGKTRLLSDFAAAHGNALVVGGRPGDARVPYALLANLLRALVRRHGVTPEAWVNAELARLVPELGEVKGKFDPLRLQMAVLHALESWHDAGLHLLVIDDLHFADEATLEMLPALATAAEAHIVWLLGVRANEMPAAISAWTAQQDAGTLAQVTLAPLDEPAVLELLESLALPGVDAQALAPMLARHTGGNPLFMLETLRAVLAQDQGTLRGRSHLPAPSSVGELIERRLNQLSPPAMRLARVAALAGQDFSAELAATVLCLHALDIADAWRELEAGQVIRNSAFAHDLIFEATLRSVPEPIARLLHRDIAAYLDAHGGQQARIAWHWFEAREWSRAGATYKREADRVVRAARGADAAQLFRRAADSFGRAGQRSEQVDALWQLTSCLQFMKHFKEYTEVAEQMQTLAVTPEERVMALDAQAKARFESFGDEQGLALMREARLLARETGHKIIEVSTAEWEALGLSLLGRHQEALDVGQIVLRFIQEHPNDEFIALRKRQYAYMLELDNQFELACKYLHEADQRALADGDIGLLSEIRVIRAACLHNLGELDAALDDYQSARRLLIDRSGGARRWSGYDSMTARCLAEAGQYRQAVEMLMTSLEEQKASGDSWHRIPCEVALALCFTVLGQPGRAKPLVNELAAADEMQRVGCLSALVRIAQSEGKPARLLLERVIGLAATSARGERVLWQARIDLCREIEAHAAIALAQGIAQQSLAKNTYTAYLPATAMRVDALRRAGEFKTAADEALCLADVLSTRPVVGMYAPECWWIIFQALDASGEIHLDRALDALRRGVDWIQQIALPNVPTEFRDSFLNRNPVNRAVLSTAGRRLPH